MNKEPARLGKVEDPIPFNLSLLLLHPVAVVIAVGFMLFIIGALLFAVTGHSAVESGGMRNYLATGV